MNAEHEGLVSSVGHRAAARPHETISLSCGSPLLPCSLKSCRHGLMAYPQRDAYVGRSLALYSEYGEDEVQLLLKIVRPGDVVVEAGANIGADTVPIARYLGANGQLLAFEPQRLIFQLLCTNLALNGIVNVRSYHAAVGATNGALIVPELDYAAHNNFGGVSLREVGSGERVSAVMLDAFELPRCALIKADVEGMERQVLRGAEATIRRCKPRLYLENNCGPESAELIECVLSLGYRAFWHTPPLYSPENFAKNSENLFPGIVSTNMLCLHPDDPLQLVNFRVVSGPDDVALASQRAGRR